MDAAYPSLALLLGWAAAACDSTEPSPPGSVRVVVETTGVPPDPDGYTALIGDLSGTVGANDSLTLEDVPSGDRQVTLGGIAPNCSPATALPVAVTVIPGGTARVEITLTCVATTGMLALTIATTGYDQDPDGYAVILDGGPAESVARNGLAIFTVPPGSHSLLVSGVEANCTVDAPAAVTVVAGVETRHSVGVVCAGPLRNAVVFTDASNQLSSVNADGTERQRVTHDNIAYGSAAVSPDGREIAAVANRLPGLTGAIVVMRNDGTGVRALVATGEPVNQVVWAPDGRIAFAQPPAFDQLPDLCFIRPDGTDRTCVTIGGGHSFFGDFALSPDGSQVVYGTAGFEFMNTDGTNWHAVNNTGENNGVDWSPDGTRIAYQHIEDLDGDGVPEAEIYTMNVDGSDRVRLTNDEVTDGSPRWSPDGSRILYRSESGPGGLPVLKIMDADGSNSRKLTGDKTAESSGTWSPLQ